MASQTCTTFGSVCAQGVGQAFVSVYYHILHCNPKLVPEFYKDYSFLGRPDHDGVMTSVTTMKSIDDKICSLDYENYKSEIETTDAQPCYNGGVILLVTGFLTRRDHCRRKFMQTFFLAPHETGYFVLNDMFRYVEVREPGQNAATMTGIGSNSPSLTGDQEAAHVISPKGANDIKEEERQINDKEESKVSEDEAEGYSIYIGNLPPRISVRQLEKEFQIFGRIKQNGVRVQHRSPGIYFGFVDFEDSSSMKNAIQASPIAIWDHETVVEMRRSAMKGRGRRGGRGQRSSEV